MAEGAKIRVRGLEIETHREVYMPAEDSLLMLDSVDLWGDLRGLKCLDVGTGTGIVAIFMARKGCETFATDLTSESVELTRRNAELNGVDLHITQGDLMNHFRSSSFDVITFNPPYLPERPSDVKLSISWAGGSMGRELIDRFLSDLPRVIKEGGRAAILHADYNEPRLTLEWGRKRGFNSRILGRRKLAFHELIVIELRLRSRRAEHP